MIILGKRELGLRRRPGSIPGPRSELDQDQIQDKEVPGHGPGEELNSNPDQNHYKNGPDQDRIQDKYRTRIRTRTRAKIGPNQDQGHDQDRLQDKNKTEP
jgi:hypothetical protein